MFKFRTSILWDARRIDIIRQGTDYLRRNRGKRLHLFCADRVVQRVGSRYRSDEDEHDEAHAFLSVVRSVRITDTAAGENQQKPNIERRRSTPLGSLIKARILDHHLEEKED